MTLNEGQGYPNLYQNGLVVSIITPSLKEIVLYMSEYKPMFKLVWWTTYSFYCPFNIKEREPYVHDFINKDFNLIHYYLYF